MAAEFDAVVIGAGVIGSAVALGLARKGRKVLCVDKLPAAGYGSTSGSCAIIRPYYSTVDGSAIAYESHYYWQDWANVLGFEDERGLARYVNCGCMVLKTEGNGYLARAADLMEEIGCPYEHLDPDQVKARLPIVALQCYAPAKAAADPAFGQPTGGEIGGAMFFPRGRLRHRSAARGPQPAARCRGCRCGVPLQHDGRGDPPGRRQGDRRDPERRRSRLRAGGCQRRRPPFLQDQRDGRCHRRYEHRHPGPAPRGCPRAVAQGVRLRAQRRGHVRQRHLCLYPPGTRQPYPGRLRRPRMRSARMGRPG